MNDKEKERVFSDSLSENTSSPQPNFPQDFAVFQRGGYSNDKVSIEIDSDVFELARCLCFLVPTISPQELLENILLEAVVKISSPFSKEIRSTFKRNPYDKLVKYVEKGGD